MKAGGWFLLSASIFLIALGGILATGEVQVLEVLNPDRGGRLLIQVEKPCRFVVGYLHSMYLQPAAEEFEVGEGEEIILRGVRTQSSAVAQYYGFEDGRDYYLVDRKMKSFALRLGISQAQTLTHGERKISLEELGEKGDRLEFRVVRTTLAHYLLSGILKEKG